MGPGFHRWSHMRFSATPLTRALACIEVEHHAPTRDHPFEPRRVVGVEHMVHRVAHRGDVGDAPRVGVPAHMDQDAGGGGVEDLTVTGSDRYRSEAARTVRLDAQLLASEGRHAAERDRFHRTASERVEPVVLEHLHRRWRAAERRALERREVDRGLVEDDLAEAQLLVGGDDLRPVEAERLVHIAQVRTPPVLAPVLVEVLAHRERPLAPLERRNSLCRHGHPPSRHPRAVSHPARPGVTDPAGNVAAGRAKKEACDGARGTGSRGEGEGRAGLDRDHRGSGSRPGRGPRGGAGLRRLPHRSALPGGRDQRRLPVPARPRSSRGRRGGRRRGHQRRAGRLRGPELACGLRTVPGV